MVHSTSRIGTNMPSPLADEDKLLQLQAAREAALQAARSAVRDTTRLTRLLASLSEPGTIEILLDRALSTLSELFIADIVVLHDPIATGSFMPLAAIGIPESLLEQDCSYADNNYLRIVMRDNRTVRIGEAASDPRVDRRLCELDVATLVALPVRGENVVRGVLVVARCRPEQFDDAEVDLLNTMAYRIGLALEDAQLKSQLEQITQSGKMLGRHLNAQLIAAEAARSLSALVGADGSGVVLRQPRSDFCCLAQQGLPVHCRHELNRLARYFVEEFGIQANQLFCTDTLTDLLSKLGLHQLQEQQVRSLLVVPILRKDGVVGLLFALRLEALSFNQSTMQMGLMYGNYVSVALENAVLYEAVQSELAERVKAEQALRGSDERFRALIRSVSDIIAILSANGTIHYISPAAESLWDCSAISLHGQNILDRLPQEDSAMLYTLLAEVCQKEQADIQGAVRCVKGDGDWRTYEVTLVNLLHDPAVNGIVATFHDVTERKVYERELTKLAYRDPLTGLANRAYFMERLHGKLARSNSLDQSVAVIFFDLDSFKKVNDTLGHAYGDRVLCAVADRVRACLRREDTAARLGGDEFTLLIEGITDVEHIVPMAERLLRHLHEPMEFDEHVCHVGGSMGIALSEPGTETCDSLLRKADLAMYAAKNSGKGCFKIYEGTKQTEG